MVKTKHPLYHRYNAIKSRCLNPKDLGYKNYGGRGILMCDRWLNSFENFIEDIGERPSPNHSIDRINNNGNYEPVNCRWATSKEQSGNRRLIKKKKRDNIVELLNGMNISNDFILSKRKWLGQRIKEIRKQKKLSQRELSKMTDINYTAFSRIESGQWAIGIDTFFKIATCLNLTLDFVELPQ